MTEEKYFVETKEYKKFVEFCEACKKYKYIGICYGAPGVGKTLSARYYSNWDYIEKNIANDSFEKAAEKIDENVLECQTIFYTAPAVKATQMLEKIRMLGVQVKFAKNSYRNEEDVDINWDKEIDLIIVDEIDRLKIQNLEQLRDIYDQNNVGMIFIGMPGIEKRLARYPQLYSRIGFAHEYNKLSKDETKHILEYKLHELDVKINLEDFSDYEAISKIIRITDGNFRLIQRLFSQIERILEINQLDTITAEVVEAARDSLVIGGK
ncbi:MULTISPECIES: AAA family ATPase [Staphylococcus]|uniref:ORC1/DEAH AAA+ ATPase domain-containing protein n=3 Tax=Staphylococcus TaxID=1279 RepID=A0A7G3T861_9STAP|nr:MULTISPECIES: AAA family ATPase [Staphylococcus]QJR98749.1 hypothetical protein [Staphylococcus arlettae]QJR98754.1 hypothetical protein [Staphylococcus equorum]AKJ75146.1 hypothetical protein [Staphylococcus epidermidis]MDO6366925.1 AAA family ATPase [Staphylococcus epidermidis]MDO6380750.1 AAA family ATPase [Staphylococcus epidermidis]